MAFIFSVQCSSGTYGYNCAESCGHCLGTSACDPVDGRCANGCEPGWQTTDKCDKSEQHTTYFLYLNLYTGKISLYAEHLFVWGFFVWYF